MSEEDEFAKLSLPDQFQHKNWKARKGGYETSAKEFKTAQPSDPIVREFILESGLWKGAVSDSNVAAQQEALNAYNAFLDAAGSEGARKTRSSTVQGIVEKGLMGRPAAKAAALESLLLLIELDKADPIIEELLPFLAHKQPKVIAASLAAVTSIYHAYGCKTVEPKPVIKLLPKVFGHADKNVRAEAQNLTVELYRWLREAMKPLFWGELKEVQQKDLDKLFQPLQAEPTPKQERLLRSQQAAKEVAVAAGVDEEVEEEEEEVGAIDLEPEYEAVDVLARVPKDFGDRLASSKWKDRKEALDELFAAVNVPAMQEGPFDDVIRGCAKSMKDANIAVVAVAANCVECIAKGLRKSFTRYRGTILGSMLERFKEKKATVTEAIAAACDAVFLAVGLGEIEADVLEALKAKNPQVKEHTAKFLVRSLKTARDAPTLEQTKELAEASKKLLTESVATLRDAGAEILGVLWKIMGDRNMLNHLDGLDDLRKNKIKEFSDAAEVRAKWKPKAAPPAPKAAAPAAGKKAAPGSRRPAAGAKKAAPPKPATPPPADEAPLQPRATSRPTVKAPAGLRAPGLKAPGTGLQKAGSGLKAPSGSASPRRQGVVLDDTPAAAPKSGLSAPGRGLAGRPLGKPALASTPASPPRQESSYTPSAASSALSSIERQELSDLRAEVDLLRNQTSDLRQDKMRLHSQLAELQVQNAQLIEDHTRDVLQIKAKETQLTRARSDGDAEGERANTLSREIDRLKREMGRLGRAQQNGHMGGGGGGGAMSPPPLPPSMMDGVANAGDYYPQQQQQQQQQHQYMSAPRPAYGASRSYNMPAARNGYGGPGVGNGGYGGYAGGGGDSGVGGEGKENIPSSDAAEAYGHGPGAKLSGFSAAPLPPSNNYTPSSTHASRPMSNASSGRATPLSNHEDGEGAGASASASASLYGQPAPSSSTMARSQQSHGSGSGHSDGQAQGVESWRRAAEVTQNLKARIEMMKARQNIGRGQ
ncbi:hypothetical protein LTR36_002431 [Oleoguttula mirabilis]|uniref:TOG domain-containing protein n=1 Tax=Oleoguttula mirabilis TaxID=1507867 RepID=A0AAV9JK70_9PEZI|nr:hypothetical protein LTR36_002431 [Oleoguttula mirabilis]